MHRQNLIYTSLLAFTFYFLLTESFTIGKLFTTPLGFQSRLREESNVYSKRFFQNHPIKEKRCIHEWGLRFSQFDTTTTADDQNNENDDPIPPGRVSNISKHMKRLDASLKSLSGKGLFERINELQQADNITINEIDQSERFNVLSHRNQTDPIYDYGNRAALKTFGYTEIEFYALPSRYSAPEIKGIREERESLMAEFRRLGYSMLKNAVRINKDGKMVQIEWVVIWNVYDEETGIRTGQAALFDNEVVKPYTPNEDDGVGLS